MMREATSPPLSVSFPIPLQRRQYPENPLETGPARQGYAPAKHAQRPGDNRDLPPDRNLALRPRPRPYRIPKRARPDRSRVRSRRQRRDAAGPRKSRSMDGACRGERTGRASLARVAPWPEASPSRSGPASPQGPCHSSLTPTSASCRTSRTSPNGSRRPGGARGVVGAGTWSTSGRRIASATLAAAGSLRGASRGPSTESPSAPPLPGAEATARPQGP